jgi:hypothetical protein
MVNENALRETLLLVFEHLKKQNELVSALHFELKVWNAAMREMDGNLFSIVVERNRSQIALQQSGDPSSQEYDEIIQRLKDGSVC